MFIDSHCHLDFPCFSNDLPELLKQLTQQKISKIVIPATQANSWARVEQLAQQHSTLFYSLGIHPHFLANFNAHDLTLLRDKLSNRNKKCVALGEIGLDKFASASDQLQESVFLKQLALAQHFELPIIMHCVKKQGRILALLKQQNFSCGGVYHAFSGSIDVANEFIKLGFKLGVGGVITYPNSTKTRETISQLPIESLVLETDAPDMPIYQQQTAFNNPLNIIAVFNALTEIRLEPKAQLMAQLYKNVANIFSLSDD